jgi:pyruvate dehydrogenase (quinone)
MLMAELDTAVHYDLPITVIVNNNASLGQIEWEQVVLGYPEYGVRYERSIDFAKVAEACGALRGPGRAGRRPRGRGPGRPRPCRPCPGRLSRQPPRAPLPGQIEFTQAKGFAGAFLRGQPNKLATARTLVKDQIDSCAADLLGAGMTRVRSGMTP